ncbi:hypothetical protein TNCV_4653831 [Trichonephila clavipes]|nr:hypothetical protein TNCV_4653831 [Trichonephila clavipes]
MWGHGNLVVKVTDSWPACHDFEPSTPKDAPCRVAMHFKSAESSNALPLVWCGSYERGLISERWLEGVSSRRPGVHNPRAADCGTFLWIKGYREPPKQH